MKKTLYDILLFLQDEEIKITVADNFGLVQQYESPETALSKMENDYLRESTVTNVLGNGREIKIAITFEG